MKQINKFERLPTDDQQIVLRACADNPYHIAIQLLARPRSEGGLNLRASHSALQRFYIHDHPDLRSLELVGQFADAIRIKGQAHLSAGFEAALPRPPRTPSALPPFASSFSAALRPSKLHENP